MGVEIYQLYPGLMEGELYGKVTMRRPSPTIIPPRLNHAKEVCGILRISTSEPLNSEVNKAGKDGR